MGGEIVDTTSITMAVTAEPGGVWTTVICAAVPICLTVRDRQPDNFLGLPPTSTAASTTSSLVLVLPIPFEATVSYGSGTRHGPAAIIAASQQVELYDREFDRNRRVEYGIHTLPAARPAGRPGDGRRPDCRGVACAGRAAGKLVVGLGGEHTISVGFGRGLLDAAGRPAHRRADRRPQRPARRVRGDALQPRLHGPPPAGRGRHSSRCCSWASVPSAREEVEFVRAQPAAGARLVHRGGARRRLARASCRHASAAARSI